MKNKTLQQYAGKAAKVVILIRYIFGYDNIDHQNI